MILFIISSENRNKGYCGVETGFRHINKTVSICRSYLKKDINRFIIRKRNVISPINRLEKYKSSLINGRSASIRSGIDQQQQPLVLISGFTKYSSGVFRTLLRFSIAFIAPVSARSPRNI